MLQDHVHSDTKTLHGALQAFCRAALREDLAAHAQVTCLLSGGSTPVPLYQSLAQADLPWQRITPALVDERWVPVDHDASNEGMIRRVFAARPDFIARLVGMKTAAARAVEAEAATRARYAALPEPVSFCLLGMGPDGHTASLFPGTVGLEDVLDSTAPCQAIMAPRTAVTGVWTERMTLTPAGILRARRVILLFTGADKLAVYERALDNGDPLALPVAALLRQTRRPIHVFHSP